MTLGLPFKESNRIYQSGDKKGQNILVPDIKSKDDILSEVTKYFDCCMKFLEDLVGKENIVMAQVHYDEDTPHLQVCFLPIVNEVKRKCYKRDSAGNLIKENGKTILLRDKDNKIIYESIKGNFLNNDQFWKDLGGRNSFANIQDKFNKYITSCGSKLDRGNISSNKVHQTKLEYKIRELKSEVNNLYKNNKELINSKKYIKKQSIEIKNKDEEIDYWKNAFEKVFDALDIKLNRKPMKYVSDYISLADSIKLLRNIIKRLKMLLKNFIIYFKKKGRDNYINKTS